MPLVAEFLVAHLRQHRIHHQQQAECDRQRDGTDSELVEAVVQARDQRAEPQAHSHRKPDPERQEAVEQREFLQRRPPRRTDSGGEASGGSLSSCSHGLGLRKLDGLGEELAEELVQFGESFAARPSSRCACHRSHPGSAPPPSTPSDAARRSPGRAATRRRSGRRSRLAGEQESRIGRGPDGRAPSRASQARSVGALAEERVSSGGAGVPGARTMPAGTAPAVQPVGRSAWATPDRPADAIAACLDKVVEAKPDTAVLANTDGRNAVVDLGALETVHGAPPPFEAGS